LDRQVKYHSELMHIIDKNVRTSHNPYASPRKLIPIVGAIGKFQYDLLRDESNCDEVNRLIVGLDSNQVNFKTVLSKVDIKSKTKFTEMTVGYKGNDEIVQTSPDIQLANGNVIQDTYRMRYSQSGRLIYIEGACKLLRVA